MKKEYALWKYIVGILLGIGLNIGPMYLVQYVLNWPFFMDTIGSITVAFYLGGIPGILCAVLTEFLLFYIEHYISWIVCLYGLTVWASVGIVVLINKSIKKSESKLSIIIYLFIISILMALAVSIIGGIVNTIDNLYQNYKGLTGVDNNATSFFMNDLFKIGFNSLFTNIISRIPSNLIERPVTTFAAYGIFKLHKILLKKIEK